MDHDQPELEHAPDIWIAPLDNANYITPAGFARMQQELDDLLHVERPAIVAAFALAEIISVPPADGDYRVGKQRLWEIDRRISFLTKRLRLAEIVEPSHQLNRNRVFFGATVTYVNARGEERTIRILGADEADLQRGEISLQSPTARALLRSGVGDTVSIATAAGREAVDVLEIHYPAGCGRQA